MSSKTKRLTYSDLKRIMLRHTLATLGYRFSRAVAGAPTGFHAFSAGQGERTPLEHVSHMSGLMMYAHSCMVPYQTGQFTVFDWRTEVQRFYKYIEDLDRTLAEGTPLHGVTEEQLMQGPIADALIHAGQLIVLRRLAGSPLAPENYLKAPIELGKFEY